MAASDSLVELQRAAFVARVLKQLARLFLVANNNGEEKNDFDFDVKIIYFSLPEERLLQAVGTGGS